MEVEMLQIRAGDVTVPPVNTSHGLPPVHELSHGVLTPTHPSPLPSARRVSVLSSVLVTYTTTTASTCRAGQQGHQMTDVHSRG